MKKTFTYFALLCLLTVVFTRPAPTLGAETKSPKIAGLLSLVLPGAGELYSGGPRSARFFFFTEGLSWTGFFAFRVLNTARENTFRSFAAVHAGAQMGGKPTSYLDELVSFNSIYDRNARRRYLEGENADLRPETPENIWEWDSVASRSEFRNLRSRATWARTRSFLFSGALIFNRFASALNAARIARKTQPAESSNSTLGFAPQADGSVKAWLQIRF